MSFPLPFDVALAFFAAALLLSLAPGPDNIFVLTQSAVFGRAAGVVTTLGLATGLCGHTAAVTLGVAALIKASPLAFTILKCVGAAYLLYLAYLSFRSGSSQAVAKGNTFPGYSALFRRGVIMNITNPKVALFFLALLPQFVDPARGAAAPQFISLGMLFILATLLVFSLVSVLGGWLALWFNRSKSGQIYMNRMAGCVFVALAAYLLVGEFF